MRHFYTFAATFCLIYPLLHAILPLWYMGVYVASSALLAAYVIRKEFFDA